MSANGPYQVVIYNKGAQQFIVDNLDAVLETENAMAEMQGKPWPREHDDCLSDLYRKGVPISEIAVTLRRTTSSVRTRIKKLGLVSGAPEIK